MVSQFIFFFVHCITFSASCCNMAFSGWCTVLSAVPLHSLNSLLNMNTKCSYIWDFNYYCGKISCWYRKQREAPCVQKKKRFASSLKRWNNRSFQNTPWPVICKPHLGLCFKHSWWISCSTLQTPRTAAIGKEVVCWQNIQQRHFNCLNMDSYCLFRWYRTSWIEMGLSIYRD